MTIQQSRPTPWKAFDRTWRIMIMLAWSQPYFETNELSIHTVTTVFPSNIGTLIFSQHLGLSPQTITFTHILRTKFLGIFILSRAFYIPCSSHIPRLGYLNSVEWRSSSFCKFFYSPIAPCNACLLSQLSKTLNLQDKPRIWRRWSINDVAGTHLWRRKQRYLAVQPYICVVPLIRKITFLHTPNTSGWAHRQ